MSGAKKRKPTPSQLAAELREDRFVAARIAGATQRDAAIAAGFSPVRAEQTGHQLEQRPRVQEKLAAARAELAAALQATATTDAARLAQELECVAFADIRQLFRQTETGIALRPMDEWPDGVARAVAGVKTRTQLDGSVLTEFKLWPKLDALRQLAQLLGLMPQDDAGKAPTSVTVNVVRE